MSCASMATHSSPTACTRGAEMRRSRAAMAGPRDHEMDSQIPYVQPHTPRCETSTSGGTAGRPARTHASTAMHPAGMRAVHVCTYGTIRHQLIDKRVKEHSISNRLLWGALAHINMRFRQRNIPEAEVDGPRERGLRIAVVSPEVRICRFAALVRTSNVERRSELQE